MASVTGFRFSDGMGMSHSSPTTHRFRKVPAQRGGLDLLVIDAQIQTAPVTHLHIN
ncbi:MAG: hypothetical protein IPL01_05865 [Acidobacteria bacterium]|nr:hypothetical protein [Acidobacteriota bacterium]